MTLCTPGVRPQLREFGSSSAAPPEGHHREEALLLAACERAVPGQRGWSAPRHPVPSRSFYLCKNPTASPTSPPSTPDRLCRSPQGLRRHRMCSALVPTKARMFEPHRVKSHLVPVEQRMGMTTRG